MIYPPRGLHPYRPLSRDWLRVQPANLIPGPNDLPEHGIYHGDCRVLGKLIADNSVDLILCDPVYNFIWQYEWLARFAARVLKPGRSVVAQAGHIHRFEAECIMGVPGLIRRPLLEEVMTGGFGRNWMHKALRTSQPYIWLTKEQEHNHNWSLLPHKWVKTTFFGAKDKSTFLWGDGERAFAYMLQCFTNPGDLVIDPFSGSGTVAAVCAKLDRRYIAFELDEGRVEQSRRRLSSWQLPMFAGEVSA